MKSIIKHFWGVMSFINENGAPILLVCIILLIIDAKMYLEKVIERAAVKIENKLNKYEK